jgi:hypothetical protein
VLVVVQRPATIPVPAMQESVPQIVPEAYLRQAPAPSQVPSSPQVAAPESVHCMNGSWPAGTFAHVPALPVSAQDLQVPVQAAEQQTPCAHTVELHSASLPQVAPTGFLPQLPPMQLLGAMQSASVMQVVRQATVAPVAQTNGAHVWLVPPAQAPRPSQRPSDVSVEPAHPDSWHFVPLEYF